MDLSRPLTDRNEIWTHVWFRTKAENLLSKFFCPTPKIWRGKTQIGQNTQLTNTQIIEDRRQSEARNFETAQHIDTPLSDVSSTINALQSGNKLGAIATRSFEATY